MTFYSVIKSQCNVGILFQRSYSFEIGGGGGSGGSDVHLKKIKIEI